MMLHPKWRGSAGLTLIELVAAMALFALVAVMGLQVLGTSLRQRDRLNTLEQEVAGLSLGLALLRNDLSAMVPLLFHPPGGGSQSALALSRDGRSLSFSIGGQPDLLPVVGRGFHRVEWRFDPQTQQFIRRVWPVLAPAESDAAQPEVAYFEGLTNVSVRSHWPQLGWLPGVESTAPRAAADTGSDGDGVLASVASHYSDSLPQAVEITLHIDGIGAVRLLESLQ
jgi:general secretion pathway protein J